MSRCSKTPFYPAKRIVKLVSWAPVEEGEPENIWEMDSQLFLKTNWFYVVMGV
jgi:hypothetical protein